MLQVVQFKTVPMHVLQFSLHFFAIPPTSTHPEGNYSPFTQNFPNITYPKLQVLQASGDSQSSQLIFRSAHYRHKVGAIEGERYVFWGQNWRHLF